MQATSGRRTPAGRFTMRVAASPRLQPTSSARCMRVLRRSRPLLPWHQSLSAVQVLSHRPASVCTCMSIAWHTSSQLAWGIRRLLSALLNTLSYLQAYCVNMRTQWGTAPATSRSTGTALSDCRKRRWASNHCIERPHRCSTSTSAQHPACSTHLSVHMILLVLSASTQ